MSNKEQIFEQSEQQDIAALKKLSGILDHISMRVVLVKGTPTNKRYIAEYGEDKAYINITDSNTIINIFNNGNKTLHCIVSAINSAEIESALATLKDQLALQSKMGPLMSVPGVLDVHTKTLAVKIEALKVQQQTLRANSVKEKY